MQEQMCPMFSTTLAVVGSNSLAHPSNARRTVESIIGKLDAQKVALVLPYGVHEVVDRTQVYSLFLQTRDCSSKPEKSGRGGSFSRFLTERDNGRLLCHSQ